MMIQDLIDEFDELSRILIHSLSFEKSRYEHTSEARFKSLE